MTDTTQQRAVIYCRVSSPSQVEKGDGLGSQETRCREFAKHKGHDIVEVFRDEGASGGMIDRPAMQDMLRFLKKKNHEQTVVIIDDISRLARGLEAHIQLRYAINDAGGKLESPSIEFGEDSDSQLVENLLASVSQHQRQKNAEQTKNRMRSRMLNGYWVFHPPLGYHYKDKVEGHVGKLLVKKEPVASIVQEALEGFASGRFESQSEVVRFLESQAAYPKNPKGGVYIQRIIELFSQPLYAGYIDVPGWGINFQPGKHEPLISFETWTALQERLKTKAKAPTRKDIHEDFPLRGFVTCVCCDTPMTANWSTGRKVKYPYYLCRTRDCPENGKSIRKEKIEADFEALLMQLRPSQNLFFLALEMFRELWDSRAQGSKQNTLAAKNKIVQIEKKVGQFLDRLVDTQSTTLVNTYENKIRTLEEEKALLQEKVRNCGRPLDRFDETFRTAITFLANPHQLWVSDRMEDKRAALKLVFATKLPYDRNQGFRTAQTSLPFSLLSDLEGGKSEMVPKRGLEPPQDCSHMNLNHARLPIPPLRQ